MLPERCANVCFGGIKRNRLFMAASQSIYSFTSKLRVPSAAERLKHGVPLWPGPTLRRADHGLDRIHCCREVAISFSD
jgi:hypothetical protein